MKVTEIAFVAYPVTGMQRARKFYESTLGLVASREFGEGEEKTWIEYDIGPSTLAICGAYPDWKPSAGGGSVALEVDDIDETLARLAKDGVQPFEGPFDTPVCRMAVVSDPDGNSVIIHQRKS